MFWIISAVILLLAGTATCWPLLRSSQSRRLTVLALILVAPLGVYWLYLDVGTPQALKAPLAPDTSALADADMDDLTEKLKARLSESEDDLEGWLLLSRSYKTLQKYPQALAALQTANRIAPNNPIVMVEMVEAQLFASGNPVITDEMISVLEQAIETEPSVQKGLWLLGIAAAQSRNDALAIQWWEKLLLQVEPDSPVALSVREQVAEARTRLGQAPANLNPQSPPQAGIETDARVAITDRQGFVPLRLEVELAADLRPEFDALTERSALFIIVRSDDVAAGPPLGAKRIDAPVFPLQLSLTDQDSMMAARPISSSARLVIQARISRDGQALPVAGDWQSSGVTAERGGSEPLKLIIDHQVP